MQKIGFAAIAAIAWIGLSVPARAENVTVYSEDFETTTNAGNWTLVGATPGGASSPWYGTGDPSAGTQFEFGGSGANLTLHFSAGGARQGTLTPLAFPSFATSATISFDLRYEGNTNPFDTFPFEDLDGAEQIVLEYDSGGGFTLINQFAPNDATFATWGNFSTTLSGAAISPATTFRWRQLGNSGQPFDHWAIDNLSIVANPEPSSMALFGLAGLGLGLFVRRRRKLKLAAPQS